MDAEALNDLAAEMLDLVEARAREPETRAPRRIAVSHYMDPGQFALERDHFRKSPLKMAFSAELPEPGSVKTNDYTGVPIVMVRGRDGVVRAFANICRHRGGRLVEEPDCRGSRRALTCRYHGWSFDLQGALKGVHDEALFGQLDREAHGLVELPCQEKYGLVFVNPTPGGPCDIDDVLGPELAAELGGWKLETMQFVQAAPIVSRSNWKFQFDTFLEAYHVQALHQSTIGPLSLGSYALHRFYGPHQRIIFAARSILGLRDQPRGEWQAHKHLTIVYVVAPNLLITYGSLWVQAFELYPGETLDAQATEFALYCRKPMVTEEQKAGGRAYFDLNMNFVPVEDYVMGRQVTEGAATGLVPYHLFGHAEDALMHMHTSLRRTLGLDPEALIYSAAS